MSDNINNEHNHANSNIYTRTNGSNQSPDNQPGRVTAEHTMQVDLGLNRICLLAYMLKQLLQCSIIAILLNPVCVNAQGEILLDDDFARILGRCKMDSRDFDGCMKDALNDLRAYFPTGIPSYNIKPFDPHRSNFVELRRGDQTGFGGFKIILRNISEYGWSRSVVTKYRTDFENKRIIYAQHFPEKSLEGWYEFSGKILGAPIKRRGFWNMTLYDYSQTTSIRRLGGEGALLKVHVEVDRIGDLKMHIENALADDRIRLNSFSDGVINSMWPIGFPIIKPIINELVSSAFTDIFNESFRYFPLAKFLG